MFCLVFQSAPAPTPAGRDANVVPVLRRHQDRYTVGTRHLRQGFGHEVNLKAISRIMISGKHVSIEKKNLLLFIGW